jgi:hypothetical protein
MLGLRLHYNDEKKEVPGYLKCLARCCRCCSRKNATNNNITPFIVDGTKKDFQESKIKSIVTRQITELKTRSNIKK